MRTAIALLLSTVAVAQGFGGKAAQGGVSSTAGGARGTGPVHFSHIIVVAHKEKSFMSLMCGGVISSGMVISGIDVGPSGADCAALPSPGISMNSVKPTHGSTLSDFTTKFACNGDSGSAIESCWGAFDVNSTNYIQYDDTANHGTSEYYQIAAANGLANRMLQSSYVSGATGTMHVFSGNASKSSYQVSGSVSSGTCKSDELMTQQVTGATATVANGPTGSNIMYIGNYTGSPDSTHKWVGGTSACQYTPTVIPNQNGCLSSATTGVGGGCTKTDFTIFACYGSGITTSQYVKRDGSTVSSIPPCSEHPTLTDLIEGASLNWKFYGMVATQWDAPGAIAHICGAVSGGACTGSDYTSHVTDITGSTCTQSGFGGATPCPILADISGGTLATVTWLSDDFDHDQSTISGAAFTQTLVTALKGSTQYWTTEPTLLIITWDSSAGWYDYYQSPSGSIPSDSYGLRVPLIVVSKSTQTKYPGGHVNNIQYDYGSILKTIENNFSLAFINGSSPYYLDFEAANDLSDFY